MKPYRKLFEVLLVASIAVSAAAVPQSNAPVRFTLEPERNHPGKIHASFQRQGRRDGDNHWSTGFMPSELLGLEVSSFHASGTRPIHFTIARDSGRLDCSGRGGGDFASGSCDFAQDPRFLQLLASKGIAPPTYDQSFGMMALNVRRELIEAVTAARFPSPRVEDLMALAALGVDGRYIADMTRAGYRPQTVRKLVEMKALGITPAWIAGFARIGYINLPGDGFVQLRALGITPQFIEGFQRIGYRDLPVSTLVQLKALDITPEFVRSVARDGEPMPPINRLAELRMFSNRH